MIYACFVLEKKSNILVMVDSVTVVRKSTIANRVAFKLIVSLLHMSARVFCEDLTNHAKTMRI
jgi:hypothetical protein